MSYKFLILSINLTVKLKIEKSEVASLLSGNYSLSSIYAWKRVKRKNCGPGYRYWNTDYGRVLYELYFAVLAGG